MSKRWGVIALVGLLACGSIAHAQSQSWDKVLSASRRFVVLDAFGGEAVLDKETGLVWERMPGDTNRDLVRTGAKRTTWQSSLQHCSALMVGNRGGWRLPTIEELMTLMDPTVSFPGPALPLGHPFMIETILDFDSEDEFWSATTAIFNTLHARRVDLAGATQTYAHKDNGSYTWCVRGGQGLDPQ